MRHIDLNADVGEHGGHDDAGDSDRPERVPSGGSDRPGLAGSGPEDALLEVVTSASIACGGHAGTPVTMATTVEAASRRSVVVGAHPSYPDRDGYGRRHLDMTPGELTNALHGQVGALVDVAHRLGARVRFVKPHGALYNELADDGELARVVASAVRSVDRELVLLLLAGSPGLEAAEALGVTVAAEAFADRAYRPDGRLVPRDTPGAVLTDAAEVARRAVALAVEGRVPSAEGDDVAVRADSLCVHGDTPGALALASAVRRALEDAGVTVAPFVA